MTFEEFLSEAPLVAILRGLTPDRAVAVGTILVDAGFRCLEVPLNSPDPLLSIRRLAEQFGDRAIVGAGTVLDVASVGRVAEVGGRVVVSPNCNPEVIRATKIIGMISMPGIFTPTEAFAAIAAGADGLKLFPAEVAALAGLRAMKAVVPPHLPMLAVGGVTAHTIGAWHAAGAGGFGIGSALFRPDQPLEELRRNAQEIMAAWRGLPSSRAL